MNRLRIIPLALLALALCALPSQAQDKAMDYTKSEGFFDFGDVAKFSDGEEMVEIELTQPLLGMFAKVVEHDDPELGTLLSHLLLVNVRVFSFEAGEEASLSKHIDKLSDTLNKGKWERIVRARDDEESVNIYVKMSNAERGRPATDDTAIEGLVVLVKDEYEAVFVNVVGHFGMEEVARIGTHFDIPHMDEFNDGRSRRSRRHQDDDDDTRDDG
jgi:hypothetical protein